MKFTIEKKAGLAALTKVAGVVEGKNTIPILSNLLLLADKGRLSISATDLDMEASIEVAAEVAVKGSITAPARLLVDLFRTMPDGADAELSYDNSDPRLLVRSGRAEYRLPVLPAGDFPIMSDAGLTWGGQVDCEVLARMLAKTSPSISTEETRYYLNGLYIHVSAEGGSRSLRAVSTDGHRLNMVQAPLAEGFLEGEGVIIPRKTVREMVRLLAEKGDGLPTLRLGAQKVQLRIGDVVLTSKTIDGAFPDYMRVIPRGNDKIVIVDRQMLGDATKRVAIVSGEKSKSVKLSLATGSISLMVRNMEAGQASDVIEADYGGEDMQVGFNARYVTEALDQIDAEAVEFQFADPASPALLIDGDNPDNRFVLMPLRV